MADFIVVANNIRGWSNKIGKLPAALERDVALFDAMQYVGPEIVLPGIDSLTVDNLSEVTNAYATAIAAKEAFNQAFVDVRMLVARKLMRTAAEVAPQIIKQFKGGFNDAVQDFRDAAHKIPSNCEPDSLVQHGPAALEAYYALMDAQARIESFEGWLLELENIPNLSSSNNINRLGVVVPATREAFTDFVHVDDIGGGVNAGWVLAAKDADRFSFQMRLPKEIAATIHELESYEPENRAPKMVMFR